MKKILVVDDEPNIAFSISMALNRDDWEFIPAHSGAEGMNRYQDIQPDLALVDIRLTDMSGLEWIKKIHKIDHTFPMIVMTAYSNTETAISAMKSGAFEYMTKPLDIDKIQYWIEKGLEARDFQRKPVHFGPPADDFESDGLWDGDRIVGSTEPMNEVYKSIGRIASQDVNVLIMGESGTGKELVARSIYRHSKRFNQPFLAINCAAIPEALLESELFGHERGAFSGADRKRVGKFEQVHGGTIFLDEIGDMSPNTQAKILRVLQDQKIVRVGGNEEIQVDVRIISATNRNLDEMAISGDFREDLLYRLNGFQIKLPPLRDRGADIPLLAKYFAYLFSKKMGKPVPSMDDKVLELLANYSWPGNIREFQAVIRYAIIQSIGAVILPASLPAKIQNLTPAYGEITTKLAMDPLKTQALALLESGANDIYWQLLEQFDQTIIGAILDCLKGNQVQASQLLGISRNTLRSKIGKNRNS